MLAGHFQRHSLKTRVTLFTIAVFIVSLWGLSFMTSRMLHADMQRGLGQQQSSALNLLSQFVNQGLEDRLAALGKVAQQISLAQMKPSADLQNRLNQSVSLQGLFNGGAFVVNPQYWQIHRAAGVKVQAIWPTKISSCRRSARTKPRLGIPL